MLCKEKLTHFQLSPEVFYNVLSIRAEQADALVELCCVLKANQVESSENIRP